MATASNPIHPYKKHLLESQNVPASIFEEGSMKNSMANETQDSSSTEQHSEPRFIQDSDGRPTSVSAGNGTLHSISPSPATSNSHTRNSSYTQNSNKMTPQRATKSYPNMSPMSQMNNSSGNVHNRSMTEAPFTLSDNTTSSISSNAEKNKKRTKSVDLSHMYLLTKNNDTKLTSTNESVADLSHQMISHYLGNENNSSLVPRLKTLEMYRDNVKKSKDPNVLFQYAQYMLQTALTIESSNVLITTNISSKDSENVTQADLKKQFLREAQHYLKKLSIKGYTNAQYLLADAYSSGVFGKVDNKEAYILFQAAAKHGHIESAYRTAHCLEEGLGTTRDSRKSLNFLKFAASRNHASAMFKLGLYSFYGRMGLSNDINTKQNGIKWLSRAAARASELTCAAPYELAKIYEEGFIDIIIPDEKYAMELYIQAATLGHTKSATLLGQIYESGNSVVSQDVSLSVHYYTKAALQGDPVAMLGLCAWYLLGAEPAFEKDETEAFQWASRAAAAGLPKAQFTLGYFYENAKGCDQNMGLAWKWYRIAAENNDPRALNKVNTQEGTKSEKKKTTYNHKKNKSVSTINLFSGSNSNAKTMSSPDKSIRYSNYFSTEGDHLQANEPKPSSEPQFLANPPPPSNVITETNKKNSKLSKRNKKEKSKDKNKDNKKSKDCIIM
ncbi:hypothetical protein KAFR_0L01700 [Kazachstania africana CBS 2517]|uniref:Protein SKT5 n=1 Tax=Kazachstania africana (strain ATCC 22294 / BCRC 22015 / CBS 2517 / CECT 1963 / NBRC 1671 / NRRL Y-8276) TaxID=1071382 RepID=H2B2D0_KAZAF|nr:hypothetical protein KAFR_0L01700 [Kazachstania africana CBS 2517]CCF60780.1 hypothetical protein KAFR_0L01700 [Kazachstania africana CBS 2517]